MTNPHVPRRKFLKDSLLMAGGLLLAPNFISCGKAPGTDLPAFSLKGFRLAGFEHGVASFDPTASGVIIWTRYTTDAPLAVIRWQLATDSAFQQVLRAGSVQTDAIRDYTVAVEIQDLPAGQQFYYRFSHEADQTFSDTGETITIAASPAALKLAVCSCAHYAAGLFHVYDAIAKSDADIVVHLGDYIYEYGDGEYGTGPHTATLGRQLQPAHELLSLTDYRERYRQYRTDPQLKLAHRLKPFICVWDDHEIADDTYMDGAKNHQPAEGSFQVRKQAALQAYSEYVPFKTNTPGQIYRNFTYGSLVSLNMLDTRVIGRQKQLSYNDYLPGGQFDQAAFLNDWHAPSRSMLGTTQRDWLITQVNGSNARWQLLGQQVLMGKQLLPENIMKVLIPILANVIKSGPAVLNSAKFDFAKKRLAKMLTDIRNNRVAADTTGLLPFNLDAWDGYPAEREYLYNALNKTVISLAGDTHNAWYNFLNNDTGIAKGKELATPAVTSPGLEAYLSQLFTSCPDLQTGFETLVPRLAKDVSYVNASKRGYVKVTLTQSALTSEWIFVNTVVAAGYTSTVEKTVVL